MRKPAADRATPILKSPPAGPYSPGMNTPPSRFISEAITAEFDETPALEKKQGCPRRFVWDGETYSIVELISEWFDPTRRGRFEQNMRPEHLKTAQRRGSWGVGRAWYRVRTDTDRVFEIYYDRAPKSQSDRKGSWIVYRELSSAP